MTFDGKSKATSQFFYNLATDDEKKLIKKCTEIIKDYFLTYSQFQNKSLIKEVFLFSSNFQCTHKCSLSLSQKFSILDLIIKKDTFFQILIDEAKLLNIKIDIDHIKEVNQV